MNANGKTHPKYGVVELKKHEKLIIGYLLFTLALAVLCMQRVTAWPEIVVSHLIYIGIVLAIAKTAAVENNLLTITRDWYIFLFFPLLFKELTFLVRAFFPYYLEPFLIRSELFLQGWGSVYLPYFAPSFWLTELMSFSYWSYYLIVPGVGLWLYKTRSRDDYEFYVYKFCMTMFICYGLFVLMPARGPHESLLGVRPDRLNGGIFYRLVLLLQHYGSTTGAAFPSSHVAATWTAGLALRKISRTAFYFLLPLLLLLTFSVFYLGYHYALDAAAGLLVALILESFYQKKPALKSAHRILTGRLKFELIEK